MSGNENAKNGRDVFGVRTTSRGFAIGEILLDNAASGNGPLSIATIQNLAQASPYGREYERINLRKVQAVHGHVKHLFDGGFLIRASNGHYKLNLDENSVMLLPVIAEVQRRVKLLKEAAKPAAKPATPKKPKK